jgi:hypothetical protein
MVVYQKEWYLWAVVVVVWSKDESEEGNSKLL